MATLAVLPVKSFERSKQRLGDGLPGGPRRALAEAMFTDVLTALRRTEGLDGIIVVTGDITAQQVAGGHGADVVEDKIERGQSFAADVGVRRARDRGARRALLVPADCPALDPLELARFLGRAPGAVPDAVIVPDRHGTGTNALLLTPPDALAPAFGPDSLNRHVERARSTQVSHEVVPLPSLGLDVDTLEDLAALREHLDTTRGGAAHTRGLLNQLARAAGPAG